MSSEQHPIDKADWQRACHLVTAARIYLVSQQEAAEKADDVVLDVAIDLLDMAEDALNGNTV